MNRLHTSLLILIFTVSISDGSQRSDTSATSAETTARELLTISGGGKLGSKVFQQLLSSFKQGMPNVPEKFWNEVAKETDPNDLVTLAVPIYLKHFTVDEMKNIMAFYKTPAGAKLINAMPNITQEMMLAGQRWGKELGQKVLKKLKENGYQQE